MEIEIMGHKAKIIDVKPWRSKAAAEEGLSELLEIEGEERERWLQRQEEGKAVSALIGEIKSEIGLLP